MSLREHASNTGQSQQEENPLLARVFGKRNVPDLGKGAFFFRLVGVKTATELEAAFHHCIKFWIFLGNKGNGDPITWPVVSQVPYNEFFEKNAKSGRVWYNKLLPLKCRLSALAQQGHPLIAINRYTPTLKGGAPNHSVDKLHAVKIQVVEPVLDGTGNVIVDNGVPRVVVKAEESVFEFWQVVYDQLCDFVEPPADAPAGDTATAALTGGTPVAPRKKLPANVPLDHLLWFIQKAKRVVNATGDSAKDIDYVLGFSEKLIFTDAMIPAVTEPLPALSVVEAPITEQELAGFLDKWKQMGYQGSGAGYTPPVAGTGTPPPPSGGSVPPPAGGGGAGAPPPVASAQGEPAKAFPF
jgi:hypothetical protein